MSQEHKITIYNDNGSISYTHEAAAAAVRNIAEYLGQDNVTKCDILYVPEFSQVVFMVNIHKADSKMHFTPTEISIYKSELKKQIKKCLNITGFNLCITITN